MKTKIIYRIFIIPILILFFSCEKNRASELESNEKLIEGKTSTPIYHLATTAPVACKSTLIQSNVDERGHNLYSVTCYYEESPRWEVKVAYCQYYKLPNGTLSPTCNKIISVGYPYIDDENAGTFQIKSCIPPRPFSYMNGNSIRGCQGGVGLCN